MHTLYNTIVRSDPRTLSHLTSATVKTLTLLTTKPFSPRLPPELVRYIFELAAAAEPTPTEGPTTPHTLQLVSRAVRKWTHPILYAQLEIFGLSRMIAFSSTFCTPRADCAGLLAKSVRDLSLFDDTTGDFVHLSVAGAAMDGNAFLARILETCKGVRRLAVNYIRGIPKVVDGAQPTELTIRRGLRGTNLNKPPFESVSRLHCRYEQLMPYVLRKLALHRLTHVCFTHHLDFPDETCVEVVSTLLEQANMEQVIVEVSFQRWHLFVDPSVRKALADKWPDEKRLVARLSPYETVRPYDEDRVFKDGIDVWDVSRDVGWREKEWSQEVIVGVCRSRS